MKIEILLSVLLMLLAMPSNGQICGSNLLPLSEKEKEAMLAFYSQEHLPVEKGGAVDSVAVTIHIMVSGGLLVTPITEEEIEAELKQANRLFAGAGIEFFMCGSPRYLNETGSYNFDTGRQLHQVYGVPNTINIYFVDEITYNNSSLCGFANAAYSDPVLTHFIMMDKACSTSGSTLTHELGHFYGLFHTHETFLGLEYVDGSNCEDAGDLICDTRADPNLGLPGMMSGCNYIGSAVDPQGERYVPPVTNIMSYAPSACRRLLTEGQLDRIRTFHERRNAYLVSECDFYPDFGIRTDFSTVKISSDKAISVTFTIDLANLEKAYAVDFRVAMAPGPREKGLLLHEERLTLRPEESQFTLDFDLEIPIELSTGIYYLQGVIDAGQEIIELTEKNNFAIGVVEVDNSRFADLSLFPNPAGDELKLFFRDPKLSGNLNIRIFSYDGRLVKQLEDYKNQEEFFRVLDLSEMTTGFYFVAMDFEKRNAAYTTKFFKQ